MEQNGIVFIDEIDKVAARAETRGADVSREGVQRDLLPLIEGTTVSTKYGPVKTDHILFIASGAFHIAKPSDLLPELQGRLPIRVELRALTEADFVRILTETDNALTRQYTALMPTEEVAVDFTDRRHRRAGAHRRRGEPRGGEHRRPAAPHRAGAGLRGSELHRPRPARRQRDGRRRLRREAPGRAQPLGRPQPLRALRRGQRVQAIRGGCGRPRVARSEDKAEGDEGARPRQAVDRKGEQRVPAGGQGPGGGREADEEGREQAHDEPLVQCRPLSRTYPT